MWPEESLLYALWGGGGGGGMTQSDMGCPSSSYMAGANAEICFPSDAQLQFHTMARIQEITFFCPAPKRTLTHQHSTLFWALGAATTFKSARPPWALQPEPLLVQGVCSEVIPDLIPGDTIFALHGVVYFGSMT